MGNIRIFQEIWKKKVITKHVSAFIRIWCSVYILYMLKPLQMRIDYYPTTPEKKKTNLKDKDTILK